MSFEWKDRNSIFKGEGIYHLTFAIAGRLPLLGQLVAIEGACAHHQAQENRPYSGDVSRLNNTDDLPYKGWHKELSTSKLATVRLSEFGQAIASDLIALPSRYSCADTENKPSLQICAKQFMPDHLHVVIWVKKDVGKSIRQIAQGFRIGVRKIAVDMGVWNNDDGHPFEIPFIRTLSRKGQLSAMISYVHANPDNAWMRRLNPDLYTIRRRQQYANLHFDCMGKSRLLDYPDRQVIALSRSLSPEQIEAEVQKALRKAENGTITYTAAINTGEKAVARAVREAGHPLVVMMLDGFPAEGTEAARYYHPSGVYHKACGDGLLFLMAPLAENYNTPTLISLTDAELKHKDEAKGYQYRPIPHDTKRWRMIAGNIMLKMIAQLPTL